MALMSIDNGRTFDKVETTEAAEEIFWSLQGQTGWSFGSAWETIVNYMDDEAREAAHQEIDPESWTEADFLVEYLKQAKEDLIIG